MHFWSKTEGPILYAHRGARLECPENTIDAFRRARDQGADVLELDVHPTRDGVFVVTHDSSGQRVAGVPFVFGDSDWSQVRSWNAGWGFVNEAGERIYRNSGVRFCRLEQVLEEFPDTPLNVDVKCATGRQLELLSTCIRHSQAEDRVLLTSFSRRYLRRLAKLGYPGALGFTRADVIRLAFAPEWVNRKLGFSGCRVQVPVRSGLLDLSRPDFIDRCHRLGLGVDYWVVNDEKLALVLLDRGADGIVTDDTQRMARVFAHSTKTEAWRVRHGVSRTNSARA